MHENIALLPDPECAVGRLVFDGRVPLAVEMREMGSGGQIEARPTGLKRQDEERDDLVFLEFFDELLGLPTTVSPCRTRPGREKVPASNRSSGGMISLNWVSIYTSI